MGLLDKLKGQRRAQPVELPAIVQPEDPVNYNSVLDYLIGLNDKDYKKMTSSVEIYRKANKDVAKIIGIKDEPTHTLLPEQPTDQEIDDGLDDLLAADGDALKTAFIEDEPTPPAKKPQAPTKKEKQIKVNS